MGNRRRSPRKASRKRGVSKGEWLQAGLAALREGGSVAEITIERLARSLGIAKAGFYWHFKDRPELLSDILDHWTHEVTEVVTDNVVLRELDPRSRLIAAAEMIFDYDLGQFDLAIRQWALRDRAAARAVRKADKVRLDFIRGTLQEIGFEGDEAEMRAMVFVGYHASESSMFRGLSRKRRRSLIASRIEMLTRR
jgi:AcrR family transcriptional regulator